MKKNLVTVLAEVVGAFAIGAAIMFGIILIQSIRYMVKTGNSFAFALTGPGAEVSTWNMLSADQIIFICVAGGAILTIANLVFTIIKLLLRR